MAIASPHSHLSGLRHVTALCMNRPIGEVPSEVPPHDVRQFLAETDNAEFVAYGSLEGAARDPDAAVVLSGDYGGTIFLTLPVARLGCDLGTLRTLVSDLDCCHLDER